MYIEQEANVLEPFIGHLLLFVCSRAAFTRQSQLARTHALVAIAFDYRTLILLAEAISLFY